MDDLTRTRKGYKREKETKFKLTLCDGTACIQNQSKALHQALEVELDKHGLRQSVSIHLSGCLGICQKGRF